MKLKLAAIVLIASVALSCDTSFGCELLDRMLGRAGCSSCQAPKAPSCGCGGGLMDKLIGKSAGCGCGGSDMLTYDANMSCGPVASSCGCDAAPAADCGCGAPAAPACGGGCGLMSKLGGSVGGCGCGSPAPVADCGCSAPAPAPAPVADCGCGAPAAPACGGGLGLMSKLRGSVGNGGCGCGSSAPVADCGCSAPAPAPVADCGCGAPAAPACGGGSGFLSKLGGSVGGCGSSAPVADCGCSAAPVADYGFQASAPASDCGCGAAKKPFSLGLFSKLKSGGCGSPAPAADCGFAAPAVSDCGCSAPVVSGGCGSEVAQCGCNDGARGKLSLLDRLRGNRIPRTREGVVIGSQGNDGCNPPCPTQPSADCGCGGAPAYEAAPCTSCGGGEAIYGEGEVIYGDAQPVNSGCSTCGTSGGQIISDGGVIYSDDVAAPMTSMDSEGATNVAPVVPEADTNSTQGVIESAVESAVDAAEEASPVVDPGAFIKRRGNTVGS